MMLWQHYVFRRGASVEDMWDRFFIDREIRLLYIGGGGFDPRAQIVLRRVVEALQPRRGSIVQADQLLVGMKRYELDADLQALTEDNIKNLSAMFSAVGATTEVIIDATADDGE